MAGEGFPGDVQVPGIEGSKVSVHVFAGEICTVPAPENRHVWLTVVLVVPLSPCCYRAGFRIVAVDVNDVRLAGSVRFVGSQADLECLFLFLLYQASCQANVPVQQGDRGVEGVFFLC